LGSGGVKRNVFAPPPLFFFTPRDQTPSGQEEV
jgi:hypothetical protein